MEVHQDEYAKAIGAKRHSISGTVDAIVIGQLAWIHTLWINVCGAIVSFASGYLITRCIVKATCCEPVKFFGRTLGTILSFLWTIITLMFGGLYVLIRAIVRACQRYQRLRAQAATAAAPGPIIRELPDTGLEHPERRAILPPAPPTPIPEGRLKSRPPLPPRRPLVRPGRDHTVMFRAVESSFDENPSQSAQSSSSVRIEPVYDDNAYYDSIPNTDGGKIQRNWIISSVSQQIGKFLSRNNSPSPAEVEMDEVVTSPLV